MISNAIRERGVLFVTRKWPPALGGMETYSVQLTRALEPRLPLEVIALPGRTGGAPPGTFALLGFALTAARRYAARTAPPAILHLGDMALWPLALLARLKRPRPAIVLSAHGTDVAYPRRRTLRGRLYGLYLRLGARLLRSATIIANSGATARVAAESGWATGSVIPLATNAQLQDTPNGHDGSLLFAGRLVERKGCAWFVRNVMPLLPDGIVLKVAGTIWDEREKAALGDPRVSYLGALEGSALADAYRRAACVIVPNIEPPSGEFEGFGLVAPEAAAAGGVVLAAATGGLVDAVIDGETGFLVSSGDPAAWSEKLREILDWPAEVRSRFVDHSMRRAREIYSWSRVADDVIAVYERALSNQKPAG